MADLTPPSPDYTDKDFASLKARLFALLTVAFPEWTDRSRADFGNIIVNLFAHTFDILGFNLDNAAAESFVTSARLRASLLALGRLVGYTAPTASAATVEETFTLSAPLAGTLVLPAGARVLTEAQPDPIAFQLLGAVVFPPGTLQAVGLMEHSETAEDTFTSSNQPSQQFTLSEAGYLDATAVVVDSLSTWTEVENFLESGPTSRHFAVSVDANDRARVAFGDGTNGAVPSGTIVARYKVGGGAAGRVTAGALRVVEGSYTDDLGNPALLTATNPLAATGGANRPTREQLRRAIPQHTRVGGKRTVSREDFEINTLRLPAVSRALALTKNQDPGIPENTTFVYVIPAGGGYPSSALLAQVVNQLTVVYPCTTTHKVEARSPVYLPVNVSARIYLQPGRDPVAVRAAVYENVRAFFAIEDEDGVPNPLVDFGGRLVGENGELDPVLAWSDVFNVIRDTPGVRKVDPEGSGLLLNGQRADVPLATVQFPQLGNFVLANAASGAIL